MQTVIISPLETVKDFISFLTNGNFTLLRIRKEKSDIVLCYGRENKLFSVQIAHERLAKEKFERAREIQSLIAKENISVAWGTQGNQTIFILPKDGRVEVYENYIKQPEIDLGDDLRTSIDEAWSILLEKATAWNYHIM